jgi:hypothetical protein
MPSNVLRLLLTAALIAAAFACPTRLIAQINVDGSSLPREWRSLPLDPHGRDIPSDGSAIPPSWRSKIPDAAVGGEGRARSNARQWRALPGDILADARNVDRVKVGELNKLADIGPALAACRSANTEAVDLLAEVDVTLRFSLRRNGTLIGKVRVIFASPEAPAKMRERAIAAALETLESCLPLPLSHSLGAAMAGRPISARF